jgi:hypothetical protein
MTINILEISAFQSTIETYQLLFEWTTGISLTEQEFYFDFRASNNNIILRKRIVHFSSAQSQTRSPSQPSSSGSYSLLSSSVPRYHFVPRDCSSFLHSASSAELVHPFIFQQKCGEKWSASLSFSSFVSIWQKSLSPFRNVTSDSNSESILHVSFL